MLKTLHAMTKARVGGELDGTWRLERLLGYGGAAAVYAGSDGERDVAIKIMHARLAMEHKQRRRFEREAEISSSLHHDNLLEVYSIHTSAEDEPYMVMELLDGITLKGMLRNARGTMTLQRTLLIASQILSALEVCHDHGVIHRDLKPSNIFITRTWVIKVFDFGIAHVDSAEEPLTKQGSVLGTPSFMSPEQARGRLDMLDNRSDLFAVGAILYLMLTGAPIHKGTTAEEALILAATARVPSIARLAPDLDPDLIWLIDKALAWNPKRRFASATEMRTAVEQLRQKLGVSSFDASHALSRRPNEAAAAKAEAMLDGDEEMAQLSSEDLPERDDLLAVKSFFAQQERCLDTIKKYSWGHAEARERLKQAFELLLELISSHPEVMHFKVRPYSFMIRTFCVWEPSAPFDSIPYNLFASGIRRIKFKHGITQDEYFSLIELLLTDPATDLPPEDDLATVLWHKQLPNIDVQMVSTFQMEDPDKQESFLTAVADQHDRAKRRLNAATEAELQRTRLLLSLGKDALAEAQGVDVSASAHAPPEASEAPSSASLLRTRDIARLAEALSAEQRWNMRLPVALASAYADALSAGDQDLVELALQDLVARYARTHKIFELLRLYGMLCSRLPEKPERSALTQALFTPALVASMMADLDAALRDDTERPKALHERTVRSLRELLSLLDGRHAQAVADAYRGPASAERSIVVLLYAYLRKHREENEEVIGRLMSDLELEHAKKLVEILATNPSPLSLYAMRHVHERPGLGDEAEDNFAMEVFQVRARYSPSACAETLEVLLEDERPEVRIQALRVAQDHNITGLADLLGRRATAAGFYDTPYSERRLVLTQLVLHDARYAQRVALKILNDRSIGTQESRNTTRLIAVEILSGLPPTPDVLSALQAATRRRFWNSQEVQKSAVAALQRLGGE